MEYITKDFLLKEIKKIARKTNTFDLSDLNELTQLYRGKLLCLLVSEIDPEYKLDDTTSNYITKIFDRKYLTHDNFSSESNLEEERP